MEVSGQKALKDKNIEHCSFCEDYDITTYADGYCLECEVYICDACFVKHKGRRVNRNHSLVNVEDSNSVRTHVDDTYDTCQYHKGELVKFYCSKHDQVCCGDCTVSNHYGCKMEFISNKAVTFENSQDCKNLREGLSKCKTQAEDSVTLIAKNREQLSDFYEKFVRDVETFTKEVIKRVNSMKKTILNLGKDVMLNDKRKMDDIHKETVDFIAEISHQISLLDSKKDQPNKLFVTSLLVKPELKRAQHNISIIRGKNAVTKYTFKRDQTLEELIKESKGIGLLLEQQETSNLVQCEFKQTSSAGEAKVKDLSSKEFGIAEKYGVSNIRPSVSIDGTMLQGVKDANDKVVNILLPPRGYSDQTGPKDTKDTRYNQKTHGFSRQFSWSTCAKALYVFETKEKITVKVYSSNILCVPVDCIVNATNLDLRHGGGIARAIADAAGKDLTKEGHDYLKQHGKLRVGEVCHTGAGKMSYHYVIHAVGPCWSDYKPYSKRDVERCETDLYNAVINSLSEAEKLNMETIAVSSISSGIYGCSLDLCSLQYAKAVVDYSRCAKSPLKEIHFVDSNIEMVQVMHKTFQSMIPDERIPKSYNKTRYVKSKATY